MNRPDTKNSGSSTSLDLGKLGRVLAVAGALGAAGAVDQKFNNGEMTAEVANKVTRVFVNDAHAGADDYSCGTTDVDSLFGTTVAAEAGSYANVWSVAGKLGSATETVVMTYDSTGTGANPDTLKISTDGGRTWTTPSSSLPTTTPLALSYLPDTDELLLSGASTGDFFNVNGIASSPVTLASYYAASSIAGGFDDEDSDGDGLADVFTTVWDSEYVPGTLDGTYSNSPIAFDDPSRTEWYFNLRTDVNTDIGDGNGLAFYVDASGSTPSYGVYVVDDPAGSGEHSRLVYSNGGSTMFPHNFQPAHTIDTDGDGTDDLALGDSFVVQDYVSGGYPLYLCVDGSTTPGLSTPPTDTDGDGVADDEDDFPDDVTRTYDEDGDGSAVEEDCDDANPDQFPGNTVTEEDGVDNNCESDAPSVSRLTIGGLEVYPTITAEPIHFAVGEAIPLEAEGADDETLSSGMTYEWRIQKPNDDYETLTGASTEFTPDENGDYSISLTIRDADGELVTDSGNIFTANFSAGELPEGSTLEDGDVIYEDPTNPEGSASATVYGSPYVDAAGNIVLGDVGDGLDVDGLALDVTSEPSNVGLSTGTETHTGIFLGGTDHVEFAPSPVPPDGEEYGPYVDTVNVDDMTQIILDGGSVNVVSTQTWDGNTGPELNLNLTTTGETWVADTVDDTPPEVDPGDTGDTGGEDSGTEDSGVVDGDDTGVENPDGGGDSEVQNPDQPKSKGCSTAPGGAEWYGLGLGALALASRRRRKNLAK